MKMRQFLQKLEQYTHPKISQKMTLMMTMGVIIGNSVILSVPLWSMGLIKSLTGSLLADKAVLKMANYWIWVNNGLINQVLPKMDLRLSMPDDLSKNGQYILISNHQSWVDTTLTQYISEQRLPLTRFFTKFELLYIPIVGQSFYFLDFPMMKRYSKAQIAKNPKLKNRDLLEAKRACQLLANKPFTLLNYIEGTRFTSKKHQAQQSPFANLLKPKAGGLALALGALGQQVDAILDMSIVYPDGIPTFSDFWQGKVLRVGIDIQKIQIPNDLLTSLTAGEFHQNEATKQAMYQWLDQIWQQKQQHIQKMLADFK